MAESATRVVFVSQRFPPEKGGNAARIHDLAVNLDDCAVTVLAPPPCYPPGTFERSWRRHDTDSVEGVTVHRLWTWQPRVENPGTVRRMAYYLLFGLHAIIWLVRHLREYDAVVTTTPPVSTGAPGLVAHLLGTPWLVDVRDLWIDASIALGYLERGSALERVARLFQRTVLRTTNRIAVTTPGLRDELAERYGTALREKTIVVPNGVDTDRFQPADEPAHVTGDSSPASAGRQTRPGGDAGLSVERGSREPDGGRPTIIYTGNLGSAQALPACVRAMACLSNDAVLQLVGDGDVTSELRSLVAELGLEDRVEFTGVVPRSEIPGLLRTAAVGLAPLADTPELDYAMPTKVYEYMACGLPAIVTGGGELERFAEASGGGVHAATDPEAIAGALDELLDDDERRLELGRRGRAHVVEQYDRRAIAARLDRELSTLVAERA